MVCKELIVSHLHIAHRVQRTGIPQCVIMIYVLCKRCREQTQIIERITYINIRIVGIGCCGARSGEYSSVGNRWPSCGVFSIGPTHAVPGIETVALGRLERLEN